jgi:hypothetical protein
VSFGAGYLMLGSFQRNLTVFDAHCLSNHHEFEVYDFSDFVYGERLIHTKDGQHFALLTLDDDETVVKEVERLLEGNFLLINDNRERPIRPDNGSAGRCTRICVSPRSAGITACHNCAEPTICHQRRRCIPE